MATPELLASGNHDRARARGPLGLLRDRAFGWYWLAMMVSMLGIWTHNMTAALVAYQVTGSTLAVGAVSTAQFLPQRLLAPIGGAQADRGHIRRQLILGRCLIVVGTGGLALTLVVFGSAGLSSAWPVITASGVVGVGFALGGPPMHTIVARLVRREELPSAVALSQLPPTIARAGGPMLATLFLLAADPAAGFAFAGASNVAFTVVILRLPFRDRPDAGGSTPGSVVDGLRLLRTDQTVGFLLLGVFALGYGTDPVVTLAPALADRFGQGESLVGWFATTFGLGAMVVFPVLAALRRRFGVTRVGAAVLVAIGGGTIVAGLAAAPLTAVLGFGAAGVGFTLALTGLTTRIYALVPSGMLGRIMALWSVAFLGSRPLSAALNGMIADAVPLRVAFISAGSTVLSLLLIMSLGLQRNARRSDRGRCPDRRPSRDAEAETSDGHPLDRGREGAIDG